MDTAQMATQPDPDRNPNFRRRWGPPPPRRASPQTPGSVQGPDFKNGSSEKENRMIERLLQAAFRLDHQADAELAIGRHAAAERLSHLAAELREAVR